MASTAIPADVSAVARLVRELPDYPDFAGAGPAYSHIGALLTDAGLQAGLTYKTTVLPRVRDLLEQWPDAATTTAFLRYIETEDLAKVLRWKDADKPQRIEAMARLLVEEGVDTVDDLGAWVQRPDSRRKLRSVRGVGPKTADYLANMAGQPVAAIDRHLRRFVSRAGADVTRYADVHMLLAAAAEATGVDLGALDRAIWASESATP